MSSGNRERMERQGTAACEPLHTPSHSFWTTTSARNCRTRTWLTNTG